VPSSTNQSDDDDLTEPSTSVNTGAESNTHVTSSVGGGSATVRGGGMTGSVTGGAVVGGGTPGGGGSGSIEGSARSETGAGGAGAGYTRSDTGATSTFGRLIQSATARVSFVFPTTERND
jgi:hypothetical protein